MVGRRGDVLLEGMNTNVADQALWAAGQPQTNRVRIMLVRALRQAQRPSERLRALRQAQRPKGKV